MSENMNEIDDKLEVEIGKNIWKVDGPIGRFRFFVIQMVILLVCLIVIFVKSGILPFINHCPIDALKLLLLIVFITLWISYVAIAKRIYDITTSAGKGIIFAIILFILTLIYRPVITVAVIALMFIPGKMIKSNY